MTTPETTTTRPDLEAEREECGREAFARIRSDQSWRDWTMVAQAFEVGRARAFREANTQRPFGRPYTEAFARWLDADPWRRKVDGATRAHLMWTVDHLLQIEAWRETLTPSVRDRMNHPTTVKRAYEAAQRAAEIKASAATPTPKPKPTPAPEAPLPELSATAQQKLDAHKRKLDAEFEFRVEQAARIEAKRYLEEIRFPGYDRRLIELTRLLERNPGVMTRSEYATIIRCLHTDGTRTKEQLEAAFHIFTKYKPRLVSDEETRRAARSTLPKTVEEMMARRTMKRPPSSFTPWP